MVAQKITPIVDAAEFETEALMQQAVVSREASGEELRDETALPLIARLFTSLNEQRVVYCHWKSSWKMKRWLLGDGDLDLLLNREDAERFAGIVRRLGFKQAVASADVRVPGVLHYYGFDAESDRFVHLHVYDQLVLADDSTGIYSLPIERPFLESAEVHGLVALPSTEFEFIVFVLRAVLKNSGLESISRRLLRRSASSASSKAMRAELEYLEARADRARVRAILEEHLPFIDSSFFETCVRWLSGADTVRAHGPLGRKLRKRLRAQARLKRLQPVDTFLRFKTRLTRAFHQRITGEGSGKRLASGGSLIAVVGGDGSGKTTSVRELNAWLSGVFSVRKFHLGRPPRSPLTLCVISLIRLSRLLRNEPRHHAELHTSNSTGSKVFPGYLQLLRWVCAARDRSRAYRRAHRYVAGGGIVVCDRYVVRHIRLMEAAQIARSVEGMRVNPLVRRLLKAETNYYERIMPPDLLIVLRVDPEIAVRRKPEERETHVRTRSQEVWDADWRDSQAHVVDASLPLKEIIARMKSLVWDEL